VTQPFDRTAQPAATPERRSADRHPADAILSCRPLALSRKDALAVLLRDVSMSGLSLLLSYRFAPGTRLVVDLSDLCAIGDAALARVVHVRQRPGGRWLHGCSLARPLTDQQLEALRADPDRPAWVSVAETST
jgi:hypothetical protein